MDIDLPGAGAAGASGVGAYLAVQVLGGPAAQAGHFLTRVTGRALGNDRVVHRAARRLGERLNEPGTVHPRVVRIVLDEALHTDDPVLEEYMAGLLVAGRAEHPTDSLMALSQVVASMSSAQVHLHHAIYHAFLGQGTQSGLNLNTTPWTEAVYVTEDVTESWCRAHGGRHVVMESLFSLEAHGLIDAYAMPEVGEDLADYAGQLPDGGMKVTPTSFGARLFLTAYGLRDAPLNDLLTRTSLPEFDPPGPRFIGATLRRFAMP